MQFIDLHSTAFCWAQRSPILVNVLTLILLVGCNGAPMDQVEPVFPDNYRTTFTVVRDCRPTIEHAAVSVEGIPIDYIQVWANDVAAQPYVDEDSELPRGSILVKGGYSGTDCDQNGTLQALTAMLKEQPGFDPDDGDWHWQLVTPQRSVVEDAKTTCIDCHRAPDCLARDYMCTVQ